LLRRTGVQSRAVPEDAIRLQRKGIVLECAACFNECIGNATDLCQTERVDRQNFGIGRVEGERFLEGFDGMPPPPSSRSMV
jgi:hypothetical protein